MAQGDVLDLHDRIKADLRHLRSQQPASFRNVQATLKGWDLDPPPDDYWIEVTRSDYRTVVTSDDGWQQAKLLLAAKQEPIRTPDRLMAPTHAPLPGKGAPSPTGAAAAAGKPRPAAKWTPPDRSLWFWSPSRKSPKATSRRGASRSRSPAPSRPPMQVKPPAARPAPSDVGLVAVTAPPIPDALRQVRGVEMAVERGGDWDRLTVTERQRRIKEETAAWRRMTRPYNLRRLWIEVSAWVSGRRGGWAVWQLQHITVPRPPERRPEWAGEGDNYLRLTNIASMQQWDLDVIEEWRRLQPVAESLPNRPGTIGHAPAGKPAAMPAPTEPSKGSGPSGFTTCRNCGVSVKTANLTKHAGRCPSASLRLPVAGTAPSMPARPGRIVRGEESIPRPTGTAPEDRGGADPRDAGKEWAHSFRDHGRFGSYPVHDNYGDEGEP